MPKPPALETAATSFGRPACRREDDHTSLSHQSVKEKEIKVGHTNPLHAACRSEKSVSPSSAAS